MRETLPYVATMTTHTHAPLTIQQAIERACHDIEKGEHGPRPHAIQPAADLHDAMRSALARQSARADKRAGYTVNRPPLSAANDE